LTKNKNNILILDDDKKQLELVSYLLKSENNTEVFKSDNIPDAIAVLMGHKINLIITNYDMPTINELEFFNMLQSSKAAKKIPVVLMSNHHYDEIPDCKNNATYEFSEKLLKKEKLYRMINRITSENLE